MNTITAAGSPMNKIAASSILRNTTLSSVRAGADCGFRIRPQ
jgi:hypothetical protein